jgi:hypothetical protein
MFDWEIALRLLRCHNAAVRVMDGGTHPVVVSLLQAGSLWWRYNRHSVTKIAKDRQIRTLSPRCLRDHWWRPTRSRTSSSHCHRHRQPEPQCALPCLVAQLAAGESISLVVFIHVFSYERALKAPLYLGCPTSNFGVWRKLWRLEKDRTTNISSHDPTSEFVWRTDGCAGSCVVVCKPKGEPKELMTMSLIVRDGGDAADHRRHTAQCHCILVISHIEIVGWFYCLRPIADLWRLEKDQTTLCSCRR